MRTPHGRCEDASPIRSKEPKKEEKFSPSFREQQQVVVPAKAGDP
jgi:hypothetical protein